MSDASTLPPEFYNAFGIDSASFQSTFQDSGNEMFSLRPGWSLGFTHAVLTTGDKPKTVASVRGHPLEASAAGELWKTYWSPRLIACFISPKSNSLIMRLV